MKYFGLENNKILFCFAVYHGAAIILHLQGMRSISLQVPAHIFFIAHNDHQNHFKSGVIFRFPAVRFSCILIVSAVLPTSWRFIKNDLESLVAF